jgi:hypothetical protein
MDNPLHVSSSSVAASEEAIDDSITMAFLIKQMQYLTCAKGGPTESRSLEHLFPIRATLVSSTPSGCGGSSEMQCDPDHGMAKEKSPWSYNALELEQAKQRAIEGLRGNFVKIL